MSAEMGRCSACGYEVPLTPRGYLRSHSYFLRRGVKDGLFSWGSLFRVPVKGSAENRAILHCHGSGNRPSKAAA